LIRHSPLEASAIVRQAMEIAAELDIYTNKEIVVEELKS
jgi:ATP-dependent protease HslVU (ClpYQ) peptidase subunit